MTQEEKLAAAFAIGFTFRDSNDALIDATSMRILKKEHLEDVYWQILSEASKHFEKEAKKMVMLRELQRQADAIESSP